jgi:hypothetical protein
MGSDYYAGPDHCPEPPTWQGRFRAKDGGWYQVDACDGHAGVLTDRRRLRPMG